MNNGQLYKRQNGNYKEVYPNTLLSSILDKQSGKALKDIINAYNHLYVPFVNNIYETLTAIPVFIRRKGLWVTWETEDDINTYQFNLSTAEAADDAIWGNIESWEQVPDLDYYNTHAAVPDGSITLDKLSDEVRQWLVNAGKIINYADEEDITEQVGLLKLADRPKVSGVNSMGYKILRRNKSFAEQVTEENTIYEIKYDFTLDENVTIPNNCVLKFNGGSINGEYTLIGNNTAINAGLVKIFNINITFIGTWNITEAYPEWFGNTDDASLAINKTINSFNVCVLSNKTYNISSPIFINKDYQRLFGKSLNSIINVSSNFRVVSLSDEGISSLDGRPDFENAAIIIRPGNKSQSYIITTDLVHWVFVSTIRIEGNNIVPTAIEAWALASSFSNMVIRGTNKEAFVLRRGWNNSFLDINANYNNGNGFVLESETSSNHLDRIEVDHFGGIGILINQGYNIILTNIDIESGKGGIYLVTKKFPELKDVNDDVVSANISGIVINGLYVENIKSNDISTIYTIADIIRLYAFNYDLTIGGVSVAGIAALQSDRLFLIGGNIAGGVTINPFKSLFITNLSYLDYINGQKKGDESNIIIYDKASNWTYLNDYESKQVSFVGNTKSGTFTVNGINIGQRDGAIKIIGDIVRDSNNRLIMCLSDDGIKNIYLNAPTKFVKTQSGVSFYCYYCCGMITIIAKGTTSEAFASDISFNDSPFNIANDLGTQHFEALSDDASIDIATRDYNVLYMEVGSGVIVNRKITFPAFVL